MTWAPDCGLAARIVFEMLRLIIASLATDGWAGRIYGLRPGAHWACRSTNVRLADVELMDRKLGGSASSIFMMELMTCAASSESELH